MLKSKKIHIVLKIYFTQVPLFLIISCTILTVCIVRESVLREKLFVLIN